MKRDSGPLEQVVFKYRHYMYDKEKDKMKTPSKVNPKSPVKDTQQYQQAFSLPDTSFEYSDSFSPLESFDSSLETLFMQQYHTNLLVNPMLTTSVPDPVAQINPQVPIDTNEAESFEKFLHSLEIPQFPATENVLQTTGNNIEPFMEDFTRCMEKLKVDESNIQRPGHSDPNGIPKILPSRPNPPLLQVPYNLRYIRASEEFKRYFNDIDMDNDGKISFEELKACLKNRDVSSYTNFSDETIEMLIQTFDDDNDKQISIKEFPELAAFLGNWGRCFTFLDRDASGTIDYEEMHQAMEVLGFNLNSTFMKELIQKYNRNGSAVIDFDNFILACVTLCRFKESYNFMVKNCGAACHHISFESFLKSTVLSSNITQNA
ncbi:EF-hand [Backusella circina FSU 941]|nr:EF-hand [Backusella circina FSU 941]